MALTTVSIVKTHLGISGSTEDTLLTQLVAEADALIKSQLKQPIESATYTEFYAGNGERLLPLKQRPVSSITSIHLDSDGYYGDGSGAFATADLLTAGTDYVLVRDQSGGNSKSGLVAKIGGVWPRPSAATQGLLAQHPGLALGNIKVVYVAGYLTVPKDLEWLANQVVADMRRTRKQGVALSSERLDYYSYSVGESATEVSASAMAEVRKVAARYREWSI